MHALFALILFVSTIAGHNTAPGPRHYVQGCLAPYVIRPNGDWVFVYKDGAYFVDWYCIHGIRP